MKLQTKKIIIPVISVLILAGLAKADIESRINDIISRSSVQAVAFSIHIARADSGDTIYEHDAQELMIPASNMKIITAAAALKYLGADYEYKTKVGLCGNKLVIIGGGDPLLGDEQTDARYDREKGWIFEDIAQKLKSTDITSIEDIIVDTGVFDNECVHPNWPAEQLNRSYACEISGLNFNVNCVKISARNIAGQINISIEPQTSFMTIINEVKPITSGASALGTYRNRQPNKIIVHGECRNEVGPIEVAIEKPAAFFGYLLFEHLARAGISTKGMLIEKVSDEYNDFRLLAEYKTSMRDCLERCLKDSLNLGAESLLKTIASVNNPDGKNGSWQKGRELLGEYLVGLDITPESFNIDDGSGLSRQNKLSAYVITKVLLDVYHSDNWEMYKDSLGIGGVDGTKSIADNFKEEKYKGKILGKTGYINGVKSLSGICVTAKGDYIFSILTNNANGLTRPAINEIAQAIIDDTLADNGQ
ncbi:MAG: D-alanyl-D-alanine carboxypeptidase/D-alanyl-D-alanine-endopeptidase [Sedimentisphaerales bacterium]|nr:D-alanyl-D-alanine carboxypeptidase/D-alanyl-D-alanine-endopeptidase [Sedimentisphaerales bacterium]